MEENDTGCSSCAHPQGSPCRLIQPSRDTGEYQVSPYGCRGMARGNPDLNAVEQAEAFAEEQAKGEAI